MFFVLSFFKESGYNITGARFFPSNVSIDCDRNLLYSFCFFIYLVNGTCKNDFLVINYEMGAICPALVERILAIPKPLMRCSPKSLAIFWSGVKYALSSGS